jgi:hypothetical protein
MIKLIKDILSQQDDKGKPSITKDHIDLIGIINDFFANFIFKNKKNKEYFILKGGVSLTSKFIDKNYPLFYSNNHLMLSCCSILGNTAV